MPLREMDALIGNHFCGDNARFGPFKPTTSAGVSGREVLPGTLYHYSLRNQENRQILLQVYEGIGGMGGDMWDQEVTVLQRLAALQHPALPRLAYGDSVDAEQTEEHGVGGYAFIVTDAPGQALHDGRGGPETPEPETFRESLAHFGQHQDQAVSQLMYLADALALLHGMGVVHRNVWPGTIEVLIEEDQPALRLARFEMSALVSNLLRSVARNPLRQAEDARRLLLSQGARALAYFPPERIRGLFQPDSVAAEYSADVYGLGMVAAEWFTGPFPADLVTAAEKALITCGTDPEPVLEAVSRLNKHVHQALAGCNAVIGGVLRDMISLHSPSRPAAGAVEDRLSDHYESLVYGSQAPADRPHIVLFMPEQSRPTLLTWGWVLNDPDTAAGRLEVADLIEEDLRHARLYHAPDGATPYMPQGGDDDQAKTKFLLLGMRGAWFCQLLERRSAFGRRGPSQENLLLVKYVVDNMSMRGRQVRDSVQNRRYRIMPPIEIHAWDIAPATLDELADGAPPWSVLLDAVKMVTPPTKAEQRYAAAFDWLLDFQTEEANSRRYPYSVVAGTSDPVTLQYDIERDRRWMFSSALAGVFGRSSRLRPQLGDFFTAGLTDRGEASGEVSVLLIPDDDGRPARNGGVTAEVIGGSYDTLDVSGARLKAIPELGWIESADHRGTRVALARQVSARWELLANRMLVRQLDNPQVLSPEPVEGDMDGLITALSTSQPIFALQGPPGTGKTEMTARAVVQYLQKEPWARVLISAQSNFALDNIAERILGKLGLLADQGLPTDVVALRITTPDRAGAVDQAISPFMLGPMADRVQDELIRAACGRLNQEPDGLIRDLLSEWTDTVSTSLPELTDRLHRGANLVFATCSAATRRNLNRSLSSETFDWVVIEEAAKAWPTELAVPLTRGGRWTLVGDHRQLPAHRRREVEEFLTYCASSDDDDLLVHGHHRDDYLSVFDLFGHMFDDNRLPSLPRGFSRPRFTLRTQYRMRPAICEVVSRAFYPAPDAEPDGAPLPPGLLRTGRDDQPVAHAPAVLTHSAVVWVDTTDVPDCEDRPNWRNAGEVRIVEEILRRLRPRPEPRRNGYGPHPVAVLSPYRQQVELLRGRAEIRDHTFTIHAFQGREADIVIASLVRDEFRGPPERPWQNIGHLTQPELVNVLLSRARSNLILVGSIRHFEQCGDPTWESVCALIRYFGTVVRAADLES